MIVVCCFCMDVFCDVLFWGGGLVWCWCYRVLWMLDLFELGLFLFLVFGWVWLTGVVWMFWLVGIVYSGILFYCGLRFGFGWWFCLVIVCFVVV